MKKIKLIIRTLGLAFFLALWLLATVMLQLFVADLLGTPVLELKGWKGTLLVFLLLFNSVFSLLVFIARTGNFDVGTEIVE